MVRETKYINIQNVKKLTNTQLAAKITLYFKVEFLTSWQRSSHYLNKTL